MSLTRLRGGTLYDPVNGIDGEKRDIHIRDGRIVDDAQGETIAPERDFDANGMIVMAGGIDLHSHIGGGKTNLSRLLLPEDHRDDPRAVARPSSSPSRHPAWTATAICFASIPRSSRRSPPHAMPACRRSPVSLGNSLRQGGRNEPHAPQGRHAL